MVKRTLNQATGILGVLAGLICLLFAILSFLGHVPDIFVKPLNGITGVVSAVILGIMGVLILGATQMAKSGGQRATTGGIFLIIFGVVAYMVGGAIGATIALLTGLLSITTRYI